MSNSSTLRLQNYRTAIQATLCSQFPPLICPKFSLTKAAGGLRWKYHLRSFSGSNGPIAKETSPLLGWRPILFFSIFYGQRGYQSANDLQGGIRLSRVWRFPGSTVFDGSSISRNLPVAARLVVAASNKGAGVRLRPYIFKLRKSLRRVDRSVTTAKWASERMKTFRILLQDPGTPLTTLEAVWRRFARPFFWTENALGMDDRRP